MATFCEHWNVPSYSLKAGIFLGGLDKKNIPVPYTMVQAEV
jgi:hypothetical protein